jgi:hypothetical protein
MKQIYIKNYDSLLLYFDNLFKDRPLYFEFTLIHAKEICTRFGLTAEGFVFFVSSYCQNNNIILIEG